jgi:3-isopropylmalate/(R)-2-methylmalate dehydratase small subunit
MEIAGVRAVVAESYARIFYRNSVDGGFFIPFESVKRMVKEIKTGDELVIDLNKSTLTNRSSNKTFELKSLGEVIEIIEAGNIFEYARKTGMIPSA